MIAIPTNADRAARINAVLSVYSPMLSDGNGPFDDSDPQDLLTDLMHWCNQNAIDFEDILHYATMNFQAEVKEEEDDDKARTTETAPRAPVEE